jgi:hypothetical protein
MGRKNIIGTTYRGNCACCELCDYKTQKSNNPYIYMKLHYKALHKDAELPTKSDCNEGIKMNSRDKVNIGNRTDLLGKRNVLFEYY